MTLKELVMKVPFDNLLPYLKEHEPEHLDNMYAFREAYDILRDMEPAKDFKGEIRVEWSDGGLNDEERWINVGPMHNSSWEEDLSKEISVAGDVSLSIEELAMHCLWEITYWGFSPKEREEVWQEKFGQKKLSNPYEVALDKLEESIWRHQTPRRLRSKGSDGRRYITWTNAHDFFNIRMNRSKRKREYRQDKRKDYLRKMAKRENLVRTLASEGSSFKRSDVEFLLHVKHGKQYDYRSVTNNMDSRLAYILDSMAQYQQIDLSQYDSAVVFVRVSSRYPLEKSDLNGFKEEVKRRLGYENVMFGMMTSETECKDINISLLLNKR